MRCTFCGRHTVAKHAPKGALLCCCADNFIDAYHAAHEARRAWERLYSITHDHVSAYGACGGTIGSACPGLQAYMDCESVMSDLYIVAEDFADADYLAVVDSKRLLPEHCEA